MSTEPNLPFPDDFSEEQKRYLEGFFAGIKARGLSLGEVATAPLTGASAGPSLEDFTKEERIKRELNPLDATEALVMDARANAAPDAENSFRHKWNGLFWLSPVHNAYMSRLRITGGIVRSKQVRALAATTRQLTT